MQAGRKAGRQTDKQTDIQADRQAARQARYERKISGSSLTAVVLFTGNIVSVFL